MWRLDGHEDERAQQTVAENDHEEEKMREPLLRPVAHLKKSAKVCKSAFCKISAAKNLSGKITINHPKQVFIRVSMFYSVRNSNYYLIFLSQKAVFLQDFKRARLI